MSGVSSRHAASTNIASPAITPNLETTGEALALIRRYAGDAITG